MAPQTRYARPQLRRSGAEAAEGRGGGVEAIRRRFDALSYLRANAADLAEEQTIKIEAAAASIRRRDVMSRKLARRPPKRLSEFSFLRRIRSHGS